MNVSKSGRKKGKDMAGAGRAPVLSQAERGILEAIQAGGVKMAATKLGLEVSYIYKRTYKIRKKIVRAQNFIAEINRFKKFSPRLRKMLTSTSGEITED